jgi:hypothetical protein
MATTDLRQPYMDDGIRTTNFFNGRVLFSEDLRREQDANKAAHELIGQAIGEGVAFGLEVSATIGGSSVTAPTVLVQPGLGFNRRGHALALSNPVEVKLSAPSSAPSLPSPQNGEFGCCSALPAGINVAGKGVYVLLLSPAEGREGRAAVSGLGNVDANCNAKALVDGVRFCLVRVDPPLLTIAELAGEGRLRNLVAYKSFGFGLGSAKPPLQSFAANPFGTAPSSYGLLDALRTTLISDEQLPLAVLYWATGSGTRFIDNWSVRRRPTHVKPAERFPVIAGDRRIAEVEAMLRQFEDQILDLRAAEGNALGAIVGKDRFRYLPPAGIIPAVGAKSPKGFDPKKFFGALAPHVDKVEDIEPTDGDRLRALFEEALYHEPIDLDAPNTAAAPNKIQLYRIWENVKAVEGGETDQLAVVFANQTLPYRGVARFGYSHWKRSRFAPRVI